jgi:formate hydrogenlyase subunit 3/multisubunit Na+/H+ antiporter MnhD subunit
MLPTVTLFYGLGFLDSYTWLRDATFLNTFLTLVGTLMVVTGGLLAAFQHHLGKIMGYAIIVETGFSLLALSLGNTSGLNIFLLLLVPRAISLAIWALTLSILREQAPGLSLKDVKGLAHIWPFTTSALVLANLALAGMPLLAGFPAHQAVWEGLARSSLTVAFWVLIGSLGLFASAVRVLAALTAAPEGTPWGARENRTQRLLLAIGVVGLFILGLFPEWALPLWNRIPAIFQHLGQ